MQENPCRLTISTLLDTNGCTTGIDDVIGRRVFLIPIGLRQQVPTKNGRRGQVEGTKQQGRQFVVHLNTL